MRRASTRLWRVLNESLFLSPEASTSAATRIPPPAFPSPRPPIPFAYSTIRFLRTSSTPRELIPRSPARYPSPSPPASPPPLPSRGTRPSSLADGLQTAPMWMHLENTPRWAMALGFGGLFPFLAFSGGTRNHLEHALALLPMPDPTWTAWIIDHADLLHLSYAATIVSFLGGVHWGAAMLQYSTSPVTGRLVWGVLPQIAAFPAVAMPAPLNSLVLATLLIGGLHVDFFYALKNMYPRNLLMLRLPLTLAATASLAMSIEAVHEREGGLPSFFSNSETLAAAPLRKEVLLVHGADSDERQL